VADVLIAERDADPEAPVLDAGFVEDGWSRPGFDLAADAWVIDDSSGAIVAYGQVRREDPEVIGSWGVVHPEHRGRGVGSALFERIERRATELLDDVPSAWFRHSVTAGDRAAAALLRAHGLAPVRHFWHMQIRLEEGVEAGTAPEGIEIAPMRSPDDLPTIHSVLKDAFAEDWGEYPGPLDRWVEEELASPSYDPSLWLVARDGEAPVGVLAASAGDEGGSVHWLGVVPSHRRRGVGAALLRHAFASLAARGLREAMLNVDAENPTGATTVYERAGMRVVGRWDLWERRT
jgi:mycothiol synthase